MTLPQDGTPLRNSVIKYFTRYKDDILQHAKSTGYEDLTVFDLISFMGKKGGKKGYENGIGLMSAEERTESNIKGYENGIGLMSAEERTARNIKGYQNGIKLKPGRKSSITWTVDLDTAIIRMVGDGFSYKEIALELGIGKWNFVYNRWKDHLAKSSGIIYQPVKAGKKSRINWTADLDEAIVRMRKNSVTCAKIASELGHGLNT
jgi:hypothetical protein